MPYGQSDEKHELGKLCYVLTANPNVLSRNMAAIAGQDNPTLIDTNILPHLIEYLKKYSIKDMKELHIGNAVTFTQELTNLARKKDNVAIVKYQEIELARMLSGTKQEVERKLRSGNTSKIPRLLDTYAKVLERCIDTLNTTIDSETFQQPAYKSLLSVVKVLDTYIGLKKHQPNKDSTADEEIVALMLYNSVMNQKESIAISMDRDIVDLAGPCFAFLISNDEFQNNNEIKTRLRSNLYNVYKFDRTSKTYERVYAAQRFLTGLASDDREHFTLKKSGLGEDIRKLIRKTARRELSTVMDAIKPSVKTNIVPKKNLPTKKEARLESAGMSFAITYEEDRVNLEKLVDLEKLVELHDIEKAIIKEGHYRNTANALHNYELRGEIDSKIERMRKMRSCIRGNKKAQKDLAELASKSMTPDLAKQMEDITKRINENFATIKQLRKGKPQSKTAEASPVGDYEGLVQKLAKKGYKLGEKPVEVPAKVIEKASGLSYWSIWDKAKKNKIPGSKGDRHIKPTYNLTLDNVGVFVRKKKKAKKKKS